MSARESRSLQGREDVKGPFAPEHYREAERLAEQAAQWMDADTGWKAGLSTEERLARRSSDLAEAQVHATLALAVATFDAAQAYPAVTLTPAQLRIVLAALADAESHRMRAAAESCGDCEIHPSGACEDHLDHVAAAQAYHDLAAELGGGAP
jgi:uncharacterized protein YyaL (SSP411 family)